MSELQCAVYEDPQLGTFIINIGLAIGIFASYIPQHIKIINRRSSEGLSPDFLLLGSVSAYNALLNIYIFTTLARHCCLNGLNAFQCSNSLTGFIQILLQAAGYILIFVLCVFATGGSLRQSNRELSKLKNRFNIFLLFGVGCLGVYWLFLTFGDMSYVYRLGNFFGLLSTLCAIIQYYPQMRTTYLLKHAGSLSIPMMYLQTPGGFIWSYSLFSQPNSNWSSWLPYLMAALLQCTLLMMCLYYQWKYPTALTEANEQLRIVEENMRYNREHYDSIS